MASIHALAWGEVLPASAPTPAPIAASAPAPVSAPTSATGVEEVVVAAPEPRYVAPTRRDRIGRIWAPVYIEGQGPFRLVLDTGASHSAVIESVVLRLGKTLRPPSIRLKGVTGTAQVPSIVVDQLEVGDLWMGRTTLPVLQDVFGGAEGVLGTDGLIDKRITINFKTDRISILRSKRQRPRPGYTRIPVELFGGQLLMFDMVIGGVRAKAMLDTGAQRTIGNTSLREALARRKRKGEELDIIGVTLDVVQGEALYAHSVKLGDLTIRGLPVTFGEFFIFDAWELTQEPAVLIGMDVIGLLDTLVIDYRMQELHLKPRG